MRKILTEDPIDLCEGGIKEMESAVLQHSPELQFGHDEGVVGRGIVAETAVEVVGLLEHSDVTKYHKHYLDGYKKQENNL